MSHSLVAAVLCLAALHAVAGLECYHCTYIKLETNNKALDTVLNAFSKLSNKNCKLSTEADQYEVNKRTCPPPDDGKLNKCVILNGTVSTSFDLGVTSINFAYHTLTRDCVAVAKDDDSYTDGCHTSLPSSGPARKVLSSALQGMAVGDVSYKGNACYYNYFTAGVGGLYYEPGLMAVLLLFLLAIAA